MKQYKAPDHNSLDGQVVDYGGQKFVLSKTAAVTAPIAIQPPKFKISPQMRFDADDEGLILRIKMNPRPDYATLPNAYKEEK